MLLEATNSRPQSSAGLLVVADLRRTSLGFEKGVDEIKLIKLFLCCRRTDLARNFR
jgi:hypothetical protein